MCLSILWGVEPFRILIVCGLRIIITLKIRFVDSYPLLVREVWIANPIHIFQGLIPGLGPCDEISALISIHKIAISILRTLLYRSRLFILPPSTTIAVFFFVPKGTYIYKYNTINIIIQVLIIFLPHFLTFAYIFLIFLFLLLFYFLELCLQNRDLITFC